MLEVLHWCAKEVENVAIIFPLCGNIVKRRQKSGSMD